MVVMFVLNQRKTFGVLRAVFCDISFYIVDSVNFFVL